MDLPMGAWVREKVGLVLEELARIADIAKDPETPAWYKRNLRKSLHPAIANALKVLLWSNDRTDEWTVELSQRPTEHGTLGLAATLSGLGIRHQLRVGEPTVDPDDEDDREPVSPDQPPAPSGDPWADAARQWAVRVTFQRLGDKEIPTNERRLLSWIAYHLAMSDHADVAFLARRFLASDLRLTEAEGQAALQGLIERGYVREERGLGDERRIALRLVVEGMNDPRHEPMEH
jgi:DNA-binding MarR family transcriptional regulator